MPDANGNLKPFTLTSDKARRTYERIFGGFATTPRPPVRIDSGMDAAPGEETT